MTTVGGESDPVYVLTGATASGKKEIGLEVARRLDAEVIALDSVKVFRGLRIGAARPRRADRAGLTFHLMGIADPREPFSVGRYLERAADAVGQIRARGRRPLFLGGTPLYLSGLLRGMFQGPPADQRIRDRLQQEADSIGVEALHQRLRAVDPEAATRIMPRDFKRISRALEVHELTGRPITELQRETTVRPIPGRFRVVALRCEDDELKRRQALRVERMLAAGLEREVRRLWKRQLLRGEAAGAIGYREMIGYLEGRHTLVEARDAMVRATWRLYTQQRKWLRRFEEIVWVERSRSSNPERLIDQVSAALLR